MGSGAILFPHLLCNWPQLELQVIKTIHIFYLYKWIIDLPQYLEQRNYPKHLIQCTMIKTRFYFKKTNFTCLKKKTNYVFIVPCILCFCILLMIFSNKHQMKFHITEICSFGVGGLGALYWNYSMLFPAICFLGLVDDESAVLPE